MEKKYFEETYLSKIRDAGIKTIIGFSGGSNLETVVKIVEDSLTSFPKEGVAILTGGTSFGIPKHAYQVAKGLGYPTIGVYPTRGRKYVLDGLDYPIEVSPRVGESEWGDETEVYSKLVDGLVIIGGGFGTAVEFTHLMKMNDRKLKNNQRPVYIAPVCLGSEKTFADLTYDFPMTPEQRLCLPREKIFDDGKLAAQFIIDNLSK